MSVVAEQAIGGTFRTLVSVDSVIALSGGILTAFVGVTGLATRMAAEGLLPRVLMSRNDCYGTHHWIIASFFTLTVTLYAYSQGDIASLGGVYTMSFLGVLGVAVVGCVILRKRAYHIGQ